MEHSGNDPGRILFSLHSQRHNHKQGTQVSRSHVLPEVMEGFHTYCMEWDREGFRFLVDGTLLDSFERKPGSGEEEWPFDQPFHLVINLALGGSMGGALDESSLPQTLEIDEIRVYQRRQADGAAGAPVRSAG